MQETHVLYLNYYFDFCTLKQKENIRKRMACVRLVENIKNASNINL